MAKTVLITGGAGFIGSHVADELLAAGHRVRVLDNLAPQVHESSDRPPAYLSRDVEFIRGGEVYAVELVFHNAYGPDKDWYYRRAEAGGGCVMDLGIHLVDLALWLFAGAAVGAVSSRCRSGGRPLREHPDAVEDYAVAQFDLEPGPTVNLTCSWKLPAGRDAVIEVSLYGTAGGLMLRNVGGSFYDFRTERYPCCLASSSHHHRSPHNLPRSTRPPGRAGPGFSTPSSTG